MATETQKAFPPFRIPHLDENPDGWGPVSIPEKFQDVPYYAPFNKGEKLGKAADWQEKFQQKGRYQKETKEGVATIFNYYYTDDDSSFVVVDSTKSQPKRPYKKSYQNLRQHRSHAFHQQPGRWKQAQKKHLSKFGQSQGPQKRWGQDNTTMRKRDPSVVVQDNWKLIETIEFSALNKLSIDQEPAPEDLKACGSLESYDKSYDRVSARNEKPLVTTDRAFFNPTTSEDPIIQELADKGTIFATDGILAQLMACTRSVYPWDVVVHKKDGKVFFDKREGSQFDLLTVNETALDPPVEDPRDPMNSPSSLSKEATFINQNFSQQVLVKEQKKAVVFPNPHPFQEGDGVAATAYKYRKWTMGENLVLVARTEIDGVSGTDNYLTIRALNEYDPKAHDWRKTLDSQKGAVLATELKNNSYKLAKWTIQALLAGTNNIKLGYVSRASARDSYNHVILGSQDYIPREFALQISLNSKNAWGILKRLASIILQQPDGTYTIMRETSKNAISIYSSPPAPSSSTDENNNNSTTTATPTENAPDS